MTRPRIISFVMSGGIGSRLWPLSREDNPKQFHDLSGGGSMLTATVARLTARPGGSDPVCLIASQRHAARVQEDIAGIDLAGGVALFEPQGRNTAAAVAVATLRTLAEHGDELVLVVPSDHVISTTEDFWRSVADGAEAAEAGNLVVFGVRPTHPETGYGYIEVEGRDGGRALPVRRFVEKPDLDTARHYVASGDHFWNTGIFLFRAGVMRDAFAEFAPEIWQGARLALERAAADLTGIYLDDEAYGAVPAISVDYAIMEKARRIAMVPAGFRWSDLGSWQSLLETSPCDENGNVVVGDVVAIDCDHSYLRSQGRLLAAIGLKDMAVVSTADATFVASLSESQNVKKIVAELEKAGRLETRFTPSGDRMPVSGSWHGRAAYWLYEEALPLWAAAGVDRAHGGFHEALSLEGEPLALPKRIRTMARQVYAFSAAKMRGWDGPADALIAHGIDFLIDRGRTPRGGFMRTVNPDGSVADATEDAYDHAFVLLALAHAHAVGHAGAREIGREAFAFLDEHLADARSGGFLDTADGTGMRRSNPHMHLIEAFLAWHRFTGEREYLERAASIVELFRSRFFDADNWALGEYFDEDWNPSAGEWGQWTEPGHHFEWASLLVEYGGMSGDRSVIPYARKLYASAIANGLNRSTGLAYAAVSRDGMPLDTVSRSWPQTEAIKAAIALDTTGGPDLKPEIEARVARLFRWHIDPARSGLWIDHIDDRGRSRAVNVPASIFYHMVSAITRYLDFTGSADQNGLETPPVST